MQSDIVDSLRFRGMFMRDESIGKAYEGTFEWFLTDKRTRQQGNEHPMFSEWLRGPGSLFWLSGEAGSGKSTLMRLIFHHPQLPEHLEHWASSAHCIKAGFFFFDQGSFQLQRSREGLLRSLMYQILKERIDHVTKVFPQKWMDYKSQGASVETDWTWTELKQGFKRLLTLFDKDLRLFLCIDGLDEYKRFSESSNDYGSFIDEDEYTIIQHKDDDYQEIVELLCDAARQPGVKICVSSRPLLIFKDAFLHFRSTELHKISARDITLFVGDALGANDSLRQMQHGSTNLHSILVKEIVDMAVGVPLWVRLVVNKVLTGVRNGDNPREIMDKLRSLPPELCGENGLFMRMLQEISTDYRQQAAEIFNLAQYARLPLTPLLLSFADEDPSVAIGSWTGETMTAEVIEFWRIRAALRLASRCVGILEVVDSPSGSQSVRRGSSGERPSPTIRFIHKTAKDWLAKQSVWTTLFPDRCRQHSQLDINTKLFIMFWKFIKAARGTPGEIDVVDAILEAIYFANRAEKSTGVALIDLLDKLDRSMTVIWKIDPHYQRTRADTMNDSLSWHWLLGESKHTELQGHLSLYLEAKLSTGAYKLGDKKGRPLLFYAAFPCEGQDQANPATTELLLKYGSNLNEVFDGRSSWQLHLQWAYNSKAIERNFVWSKYRDGIRWAENTKLLVQYGANPNVWLWIRVSKGTMAYSPLFVVIDILRGNPKMRREVTLQLKKKGGYLCLGERATIRSMYRLDEPAQRAHAESAMRRRNWDEIDTEETYPKVWRHMEFKDMDEMITYQQDLEDLIAELGPEGKTTPQPTEA
ncbi:uncharacterized protein K444DRAFT_629870 [Hyaloscypha bicolor E]|uniref:Uncharacterized protein n=1 Tax=Hyaloscypha bicolor E TaxID=1095630 RepID=A0A2J6TAH0_9HELO|nr:uncharacterized protein K444DRAFT_629870 [Hyaloscypha bicolor E]PMD60026.1 hypothetical protein K444DRAFT_629870 [Hyaloscypha bicolor E]